MGKERDSPANKLCHQITYMCGAAGRQSPEAAERISESLAGFCSV
jgi:hypothetical protein